MFLSVSDYWLYANRCRLSLKGHVSWTFTCYIFRKVGFPSSTSPVLHGASRGSITLRTHILKEATHKIHNAARSSHDRSPICKDMLRCFMFTTHIYSLVNYPGNGKSTIDSWENPPFKSFMAGWPIKKRVILSATTSQQMLAYQDLYNFSAPINRIRPGGPAVALHLGASGGAWP